MPHADRSGETGGSRGSSFGWILAGVAATALAARAVYLLEHARSDAFSLLLGDARVYDDWARRILAGDEAREVFYQAPLYPYFLAAVYALLGPSATMAKAVQALLGSLGAALLALATRDLLAPAWPERRARIAGAAAGLLLALHPSAIFFDGVLQKTSLDLFLVPALLAAVARHQRGGARPPWQMPLVAGLALGLLALSRENAILFLPVVLGWMVWLGPVGEASVPAGPARRAWFAPALLIAGWLAVILPVSVRNAVVGGEFTLTTAQAGPNFYIGNGPRSNGTYVPLLAGRGDARYERADAVRLAEEARGRELSPGEVSRHWMDESMKFIRGRPADWLALTGRKLLLAFNTAELGDTEDPYTYAESSRLLRLLLPVFSFGVIFPLAIAGLVLTWPVRRYLWIAHALALVYLAGLVAFYVVSRYRLPLLPVLLPFAGAAIAMAVTRGWQGEGRRRLWLAAGGVVLAAVVAHLPLVRTASFRSITHANLAAARLDTLTTRAAAPVRARIRDHLERAQTLDPRNGNAWHLLGVLQMLQGETGAARASYLHALELEPDRALTHFKLGELCKAGGDLEGAASAYRRGLALDPKNASGWNNLGVVLAGLGRMEEAARALEAARTLEPGAGDAGYNLGLAHAQQGDLAAAERIFREVLQRDPRHAAARQNLATLLLRTGRAREAAGEMEEILRQDPVRLRTLIPLALIYATHPDASLRDGPRAVVLAQQVVRLAGERDPQALDLLAAAQAETGRFEDAAATAARAAAEARAAGQMELAGRIESRLAAYRAGHARRE